MKILVVEHDRNLAHTIKQQLKPHYQVDVCHGGHQSLEAALNPRYNMLIIDSSLPDINGVAMCQTIRAQHVTVPILILTTDCSVEQKVIVLDSGADDCLGKPFSFLELNARIRALLRRPATALINNPLTINHLTINLTNRQVEKSGKTIHLRRKEFNLLEYLARNAGQIVTRKMILDHVWDSAIDPISNTVDVHINYLRKKIDHPFQHNTIQTIPGIGYTLQVQKD